MSTKEHASDGLALLGAAGAGAALIYLLDPKMGRRRRALARDKIKRAVHLVGEGTATTWRDACNRTRGMLHEAASLFERRPVSDQVLVGRVRSKLGFLVRHPGSIEITAEQGRVTLSGSILSREVDSLLKEVRRVKDV